MKKLIYVILFIVFPVILHAQNNRYCIHYKKTEHSMWKSGVCRKKVSIYGFIHKSIWFKGSTVPNKSSGTTKDHNLIVYRKPEKFTLNGQVYTTGSGVAFGHGLDQYYSVGTFIYSHKMIAQSKKGACFGNLHSGWVLTVDNPIEISETYFVNSAGEKQESVYACLDNNYKIRIKTDKFYNNRKNENILQIKDRSGIWRTLSDISLAATGSSIDISFSQISAYIDFGKPIVFRTSKKQLDNGHSYFESSNYLYYFPNFKLNGVIEIEYPNCKGETPTIKLPSLSREEYVISISFSDGQGYNFHTSRLKYENGYYIIDKNTPFFNGECNYNCYPSFLEGVEYNIEVEHVLSKGIASSPCPFKTSFIIPKAPNFEVTLATSFSTKKDNEARDVHINKIGGKIPFQINVVGSTSKVITINVGSDSYTISSNSWDEIDGRKYYTLSNARAWVKAGSNTVLVTNNLGCSTQLILPELLEPLPITYDVIITEPECHKSVIEGKISAKVKLTNIHGGFGEYDAGSQASKNGTDFMINDLTVINNEAIVQISDEALNFTSQILSIPTPDAISFHSIVNSPTLFCQRDGSVTLTGVANGQPPYEFSIDNSNYQTGTTIEGYAAGEQRVFVKDDLGCVYRYTVNIPAAPPAMKILQDTSIAPTCFNDFDGSYTSGIANVLGTLTVTSKDARIQSDEINTSGNTVTISNRNTSSGYTFIVTDTYRGKSCDTSFSFSIPEKPPLGISSEVEPAIGKSTATGKVLMAINGGNPGPHKIYLSDSKGLLDSTTSINGSAQFHGLTGEFENNGKNYFLDVVDQKGCRYSLDNNAPFLFKVREPEDSLKIDMEIVEGISCNGQKDAKVRMLPSGGWGNYQFSHEKAGYVLAGLYEDLASGTHNFYVVDSMGAIDSSAIHIAMPDVIHSSVVFIDSVKCNKTASGSVKFKITGGTGAYRNTDILNGLSWHNGDTATSLREGDYAFIFTDENNCAGQDTLSVYVPTPDTLEFRDISVTQTTCNSNNGRIAVELQGGTKPYRYHWTDFFGGTVGTGDVLDSLSQSGFYTLNVLDKNGCTQFFEQAINPSNSPKIDSVSIEHVKCYGDSTGGAKVLSVTAATPYAPWSLTWSNGIKADSASGFNAGRHFVAVADSNGCTYTEYFEVSSPDSLWASLTDKKAPHCYGYKDAFLEIGAHGGAGGYGYSWSNGSTTNRIDSLYSGDYNIVVTDRNNCTYTKSFKLSDPVKQTVDLGNDILMCPNNSFFVDGKDYSRHIWIKDDEPISDERYLMVDKAGTYLLEVTDSIGCKAYDTLKVSVGNNALQAEFLLSSQAYKGDTLRVYELSNMALDSLKWEYNELAFENVTNTGTDDYVLLLNALEEGVFNLTLYAYSGGCSSKRIKQVELQELTDTTGNYEFLGYKEPLIQEFVIAPNPNDGYFDVTIGLRESSDIKLLLFDINAGKKIGERNEYGLDSYRVNYQMNTQSGIYLLVLTAKDERRQVKIIIEN